MDKILVMSESELEVLSEILDIVNWTHLDDEQKAVVDKIEKLKE